MYTEIDRIANVLNQYPDTVIRVEGHADSRGSEQYNMDLSGRRAAAVQNMFIQRGLYRERIEAISFGESSPIASNNTAEGRARNRRVEIKVAPSAYAAQG
jgi:outer membrane protein OmpA-like peptidoglycan-associated protein